MRRKRTRRPAHRLVGEPTTPLFGGPVLWDRSGAVLIVAADRTLESVLRRIDEEQVDWVVVVRAPRGSTDVRYYAFRHSELEWWVEQHPKRGTWPLEMAMELHEWMSSGTARSGRLLGPETRGHGPASTRIVEFDTLYRVIGIGERSEILPQAGQLNRSAGEAAAEHVDIGGDLWTIRDDVADVPEPGVELGDIDLALGPMRGTVEPALPRAATDESRRGGGAADSGNFQYGAAPTSDTDFGPRPTPSEAKSAGPPAVAFGTGQPDGRRNSALPGPAAGPAVDADLDIRPIRGGAGGATPPAEAAGTRGGGTLDQFDFGTSAPTIEGAALESWTIREEASGGPPAASVDGSVGEIEFQPPDEIELILSAESPNEIRTGARGRVLFQIELTSEAVPLEVSQPAHAKKDVPIVVSLSAENDVVEIQGKRDVKVAPPVPGQPRNGFFSLKGARPGVSRLALTFRQGGSELGILGLVVEIVEGVASTARVKPQAVAAPRDLADDDKLALLVEQRLEGGKLFYEYTLHSEALGLPYRRLRSEPFLDRGGGPAASAQAFVERIYERVTRELTSFDDLNELRRESRALGASLSQELFDPHVANTLWPLRDRITLVQIVTWEPYIPWELLRLRDPVSGTIDDRFLCEYGMVRTISDETPTKALSMGSWRYLGATFPMGSLPSVGAELDYFTTSSPGSLRARGITPEPIAATHDDFYNVLAEGDFDVLHISCHAASEHQSIDRARLILGDEIAPDGVSSRLVDVDSITVEAEARLKKRRPLVFLNACETGRAGAVLTAWGGWPNVFLRQGAGAFVGASWSVRDKPAAAFSRALYNALLDGETLAQSASAARAAAKEFGDASWLAFKVYGHPRARLQGA